MKQGLAFTGLKFLFFKFNLILGLPYLEKSMYLLYARTSYRNGRNTESLIYENLKPVEIIKKIFQHHLNILKNVFYTPMSESRGPLKSSGINLESTLDSANKALISFWLT